MSKEQFGFNKSSVQVEIAFDSMASGRTSVMGISNASLTNSLAPQSGPTMANEGSIAIS